ncbi:methionine ABC transporter ATP-binding protein [Pseudomonas marginalis]|nr:methionine ABC transporter ATP-binding protein [Pseudomonas alliivorans]
MNQITRHHDAQPFEGSPVIAGAPNSEIVTLANLGKTYSSSNGPITALKNINLGIKQSEIFGIIGRSGAGKSTLIRTINRLERLTTGTVRISGIDIGALEGRALVDIRRKIGMIFQHFNLLSSKTVFENLALPLRASGVKSDVIRQRAANLLELVGLSDKAKTYPSRLSGGQKQRVGIARALMLNPDIILCDEATSALDPESTVSILALLKDINKKLGITIILITHEMSVIRNICDRVAVIEGGEIVESGPVWKVFGLPQSDAAKALLRSPGDTSGDDSCTPHYEGTDKTLLKLTYSGESGEFPKLELITRALQGDVELVHAAIDVVQGRPQGTLFLATSSNAVQVQDFLKREGLFSKAEVLPNV